MFKITKVFLLLLIQTCTTLAYKEVTGILDNAQDLNPEELNALRPLFNELQIQYDYITSEANKDAQHSNKVPFDEENINGLDNTTPFEVLEQYLGGLLSVTPTIEYDIQLPTVEELIGNPSAEMTSEQLNELYDMHEILQETLDEANKNIKDLVQRALILESNLLKLNKPKIVKYIYAALGVVYKYSVQGRRAAYCTYSHVPQLNESLHYTIDGIDCYKMTTSLIVRIENETVKAVGTIKRNILDLAEIYKKIAKKNTIVGKIITTILNVTKIASDIRTSYAAATNALDLLENELPGAAASSVNCAMDFAQTIPFILKSVTDLTTCLLYVDDTTIDYDFMKPEEERDFM